MKIFYKDKLYLRRAFPFGDGLRISGDRFEKAKKEEIASLVWQKNVGPFKRAVFGMLAASAVAVLVPYWVALVPAAVIGFLFFLKYKKTAQKNETETAKNYRVQKIEALNKKLKSLGLAHARLNEL